MWGSLLIAAAMMAAPADPVPVLATTPYFRTLDASDGLPSSTVWKVAQDRDGLRRQRHDMRRICLAGGIAPLARLKVNLFPSGML